jgi:SagB-type dehydrogenase family enzyme
MAPGDTARLYHELTSYSPDREWTDPVDDPRVVQGFTPNDLETFPAPCKAYPPDLPTVELPSTWPQVAAPATAVLAGTHVPPRGALDLSALARLLHLSAGVVRYMDRPYGRFYFRAAGSAGGRFPLDLYVSARGVHELEDSVWWYDPIGHALLRVAPAADGEATALVVTGIPWRTGWRYAERGFRHIYWDAGTMLAQTLALADSAGLGPRLWTHFPDAGVAALVGADGVHEWPVAIVGLGGGDPAIRPRGEAVAGAVDRAPMEFPLVTQTQNAGDVDELGEPWPAGAPLAGAPESPDLDEVILERGSTRYFDPAAALPRDVVEWALAAALRDSRVPHFVAVHAVEGIEPGLYRWPSLDEPVRAGNLRDELFFVALEQELARDASFVVVAAADLHALDDRGYREAQLDAGLVEGRLHLAAYALGFGASGMTFLDSEMAGLLGEPLAGLLWTCVGVPTYRSRPGGAPGAPRETKRPASRGSS